MGQIEDVIKLTRKIEFLLDKAGASGRGLHEKVSSIKSDLDKSTIKKLRWIATMRNKIVHEHNFSIDNMDRFKESCSIVIDKLESLIKSKKKDGIISKILRILLDKIIKRIT